MEHKKSVLEKFENYEKSPLSERYENYEKNLLCIRDVTDRLVGHMKGHGVSFRQEITDGKGNFSQEKLLALVERMLSLWAEKQREGTFPDPSTGKSLMEPYIQDRWELYASYLYLVMRCSLCQGGYALVRSGEMKEQTDFAFLLEQAKRLIKSWCVMKYLDGSKRNELFYGYDCHFGLHLYQVLSCQGVVCGGDTLDGIYLQTQLPMYHPELVTDEGNVKQNLFKRIYLGHVPASLAVKKESQKKTAQPENMAQSDAQVCCSCEEEYDKAEDGYAGEADYEDNYGMEENYDIEEDYGIEDNYDYDIDYNDDYDADSLYDELLPEGYAEAEFEAGEQWAQRQYELEKMFLYFEHSEEYVDACDRFVKQFRQAKPEVVRGFYEELEEIVDLYLVAQGNSPLLDTDKALEVYSSIYDDALQRARRYERGIQWKTM